VHFVGIDTEVYAYGTAAQAQAQLEWLEADLARVDRAKTPWVIAFGHKQGWMDASSASFGSFYDLEALLQRGRVDLYLCGHQHNYQRLLPTNHGKVEAGCVSADNRTYAGCTSMVSVVVGSPGCRELTGKGHSPEGMVVFSETYGYALVTVRTTEGRQRSTPPRAATACEVDA
jgi:hypothetical protein